MLIFNLYNIYISVLYIIYSQLVSSFASVHQMGHRLSDTARWLIVRLIIVL